LCPVPREREDDPGAGDRASFGSSADRQGHHQASVDGHAAGAGIETSRVVGSASVAALLAAAADTGGAVLESVWHRSRALDDLRRLPGNIVEVFCRCDAQIAAQRYALRAGTRAAGHFDAGRTIEELWNDEVAQPVDGGWPVIEISTNSPLDVEPLTVRIRAAASVTSRK
jgi:hypothetical protein